MLDLDAVGREAERQLALFDRDIPTVNLWDWDGGIINSSAGQDSLAMLIAVHRMAIEQGYPLDRLVVQYNALGDRVTWPGTADMGPNAVPLVKAFGDRPGTRQLAEQHATMLGLRFVVTSRNPVKYPGEKDLLDHIERRGRFPNNGNRFCTSEHKAGPGGTTITAEYRRLGDIGRPPRLLYMLGFRAAESDERAKKTPFNQDARSNSVRRVDEWYPIHDWSTARVWATIRKSRLPHHWAYDAGMRRLSCSFCVLAGWDDLVRAAALRPDVAAQYQRVEQLNLERGRAATAAGEKNAMAGRVFQEGTKRKDGTIPQRTMTQIIAAARTHPIVKELGLWVP